MREVRMNVVVKKVNDEWKVNIDFVSNTDGYNLYYTKGIDNIKTSAQAWKEVRSLIEVLSKQTEGEEQ